MPQHVLWVYLSLDGTLQDWQRRCLDGYQSHLQKGTMCMIWCAPLGEASLPENYGREFRADESFKWALILGSHHMKLTKWFVKAEFIHPPSVMMTEASSCWSTLFRTIETYLPTKTFQKSRQFLSYNHHSAQKKRSSHEISIFYSLRHGWERTWEVPKFHSMQSKNLTQVLQIMPRILFFRRPL